MPAFDEVFPRSKNDGQRPGRKQLAPRYILSFQCNYAHNERNRAREECNPEDIYAGC